jgi:probable H4MPT-linked C1 transfer pathway protein
LPCAAGNWHAQASWLARCFPDDSSLLADVGSTTTDLILLHRGGVVAEGLDDTHRLATGELVYLGVRRTPLAALGPTLDWGGRRQGLAAEWFSNTGDVFLLTGELAEDEGDCDTPDGRPFTRQAAAARVLRMVGADRESHEFSDARALALSAAGVMKHRIRESAQRVTQRAPVQRVIVTGTGAFLAAEALAGLAPSLLPLEESVGIDASACACAWALLHLEPPR